MSNYSGSGRGRTSTGLENHENTKKRKHEKAGIHKIGPLPIRAASATFSASTRGTER